MIKILYIIDKMTAAGAQKHLAAVIAGIDKSLFEAKIITLEELGVNRIYGPSGMRGLFKLIKVIRKERFDIVHTYLFSENILGVIAAKITGVKVVITGRRDTGMLVQGGWQNILAYRLTNRWVDKIVCVSEAVRKVVLAKEKVRSNKVVVIHNGVDISKFNRPSSKKNEFTVGMVANFSWIKGHKDFIEAARLILREVPNTKFLLIGDGAEKEHIAYLVERLGLKEKMLFLGKRDDVPNLLSATDVSVNASYSEGMSNTVLESMAAGVPVVATAVDGNLETVINGETGILVPPGNPQEMAKAIVTLLKDKDLSRRLGKNGKLRIQDRFTAEKMIGNMQNLYERLLTPKALFIFSQFPCYDETFILREMNALKEKGLPFSIFSLKMPRDKIVHEEAKNLIEDTIYAPFMSAGAILSQFYFLLRHPIRYLTTFLYIAKIHLTSPDFLFKSFILFPKSVHVARILKRQNIRQIHGQWATHPTTSAIIISRLTDIPYSFTGHAHDIYANTAGLRQKIKGAKFVTTCTEHNKQYLMGLVNTDKIVVNYHGLDLERFKRHKGTGSQITSSFKILSVGSLLERKGFDTLIEACGILRDRGIEFECTIAGGGAIEQALKVKTNNLKLTTKIKFTGYITQEKLIPLYRLADAFTLPVRLDIHWGIPNVLIEAMATKVPVITTNLSSISELVKDGENGFIVPERNPEALADKLLMLASDVNLQTRIGKAGYVAVAHKFDLKNNSENLVKLFDKQLKSKVRRQRAAIHVVLRKLLSSLIYIAKILWPAKGLTVLTYHRVTDTEDAGNMVMPIKKFEQQMEYLHRKGCKHILITFDDGWEDNYTNAFPILKKYGLKAIVFLTAGRVINHLSADGHYLNVFQIKEMADYGIEFGVHTINHPRLTEIPLKDARFEIKEPIQMIKDFTGSRPTAFAYPAGYYNDEIRNLVKDAGFKCAFTVKPGKNTADIDPFELGRTEMNGIDSMFDFKKKLAGAYDLLHRAVQRHAQHKKRVNILYVIWSLGLGGAERVVINLAKGLDKSKFNPVIACLNDKGPFASEVEKEGIEVIALNKKPGLDLTIIPKLIAVIKKYHINIVNTHLWGANFWGRIAARLVGVKVVIATEHNVDIWKTPLHLSLDRFLSHHTDRIIAVSNSVKDFYTSRGISADKIQVIYNGIASVGAGKATRSEMRQALGITEGETTLAVIGRLVEQKGHRYFLYVLKELLRYNRVRGLIVGAGPLEAELRKFSQTIGLNGNVIFTGLRQDVPEMMKAIDILVMPSLREGLPIIALEAMVSGKPVVATHVGGVAEVVVDGETGLLVPPADEKGLTSALSRLIQDEELAHRLGENGSKRVRERFSLERMVRETEGLYEECFER